MDRSASRPRLPAILALIALPLAQAGCGDAPPPAGALRPVKGKVIYSNASALSGLKIDFVPKSESARPASGDIGPDGSFSLKSPQGQGIAEGEYGVRLDKPGGFPRGKFNLPIPHEYFDEDGAFLSASIKPETTELPPFELKPIAGRTAKR